MENQRKLTRLEQSWILYDVGNSAFVLVMVTAIMPIFFKEFAAAGMADHVSTAWWGYANSSAALILAVLSPMLGAMADYQDQKKRFFLFFLFLGLGFTFGLTFIEKGQWLLCLVLFIFARVGWAGANVFYDAFLPDITSRERMDRISSLGYGYGYIGSVIPFVLVIGLILSAGMDDGLPTAAAKAGFVVVGTWWLLLSLPAIRHLRQKFSLAPSPFFVQHSFRRLFYTLRDIKRYQQVFLFLLAYFFYIDGVGTIISMSTAYGRDLGFGITLLIGVLLFIQVVAFPFAILYGRLAIRYSTKTMLLAGICVFCLATVLAFSLSYMENSLTKVGLFWFIAFLIASSMGGIQALSRSYFGKLIPPEKSAEFFGFYNVFGKFAAISGPFLMGSVGWLSGDSRWGVLSLLMLFVIGAVLLWRTEVS